MRPLYSALYLLLFSILPIFLAGQSVPSLVNYQAIARDADGLPLANVSVEADILILKGGTSGSELYSESHSTMTNEFGLYVLVIGDGSTSDDLSQIDWASDDFYLKTITSIDGGDDLESVAKLNSVPYSFVSYKSVIDNVDDADSDAQNELQDLELNGSQLAISNGNSVDLSNLFLDGNALTSISFDPTTNELIYLDEDGNTNIIDLGSLSGGDGGISSYLEDLNDGNVIGTHTSGDGYITEIEESITTISYDPTTKELVHFDETGTTNVISLSGLSGGTGGNALTSISFDPTTNQLNYLDENGDVNVVDMNNLISNFIDYNDGHVIGAHTSGDGTVTNIEETITNMIDNGDGTLTFTNENGTQFVFTGESTGTGNGTQSGLIISDIHTNKIFYTTANGANEELDLCQVTDNCESVTALSFNPVTNELHYIDEDSNTNVIPLTNQSGGNSGIPSIMENYNDGHIIGAHTSGDGTVTNIEETITNIIDNGDGTMTFTNENGTQVVFTGESTGTGNGAQSGLTISDIHTNKIFYTNANGANEELDLCQVTDNCESVTTLSFNPVTNELHYIDEDGNTNVIPLTNQSGGNSGIPSIMEDYNDGHIIGAHTSGDGTVTNIEETITYIIDNRDGSFSYVSEDGTNVIFDTQYDRELYMSNVGTHPNNQSQMHYIALEGPEAAAYERGESTLVNGELFVPFSDHFKQVVNTSTLTVQVTPYSADTYGIAVVERTADGFLVKELMGGTSNFSFSWEVKAVRKNLEGFSISN